MKPLTLVQLAHASEDGKAIELRRFSDIGDQVGYWKWEPSLTKIFNCYFGEPTYVRIKPEPTEYWIVGPHAYLSYGVAREYCIEHGIHKSMITHVREVIE